MNYSPPLFNDNFVCIVSSETEYLAALVLSSIQKEKHYTPVFLFYPTLLKKEDLREDSVDIEIYRASSSVNNFSAKIQNAIEKLKPDNIFFCGLDSIQETHLDFLNSYNIIRINSESDIEAELSGFRFSKNEFKCKKEDVYLGLLESYRSNSYLVINEDADSILPSMKENAGLIMVEDINYVTTLLAVNYAGAVGANLHVVPPLNVSQNEIQGLIELWKSGDLNAWRELSGVLYKEISELEFKNFSFVTFFTEGAPYSLVINNEIPCSYVDLTLKPDFFIFNNIFSEYIREFGSSIVFSPGIFDGDNETEDVVRIIEENYWLVKKLIDINATAINLSMHIQEYPYELLHICSHGGEVSGEFHSTSFVDREGGVHTLEYDSTVTFAPISNEDLIEVSSMCFPRKLDGMIWGSNELKEVGYADHVFAQVFSEMDSARKGGVHKKSISGTKSIACKDFVYHGLFNTIAGFHFNPIIFNNTCNSWGPISESFIESGARGYIGTLWDVHNDIATNTAKSFYEKVFDTNIINALFYSLHQSTGTEWEGIYFFWGLHFSRLKKGNPENQPKMGVAYKLMKSKEAWVRHLENLNIPDDKITESINRRVRWIDNLISKSFLIQKYLIELQQNLKKDK